MTETIKMITIRNEKQEETTEMTREEFKKVMFDLLTNPKFVELYRFCDEDEDGGTYTHIRFNDTDSKELQRYKHRINFYIKRERN